MIAFSYHRPSLPPEYLAIWACVLVFLMLADPSGFAGRAFPPDLLVTADFVLVARRTSSPGPLVRADSVCVAILACEPLIPVLALPAGMAARAVVFLLAVGTDGVAERALVFDPVVLADAQAAACLALVPTLLVLALGALLLGRFLAFWLLGGFALEGEQSCGGVVAGLLEGWVAQPLVLEEGGEGWVALEGFHAVLVLRNWLNDERDDLDASQYIVDTGRVMVQMEKRALGVGVEKRRVALCRLVVHHAVLDHRSRDVGVGGRVCNKPDDALWRLLGSLGRGGVCPVYDCVGPVLLLPFDVRRVVFFCLVLDKGLERVRFDKSILCIFVPREWRGDAVRNALGAAEHGDAVFVVRFGEVQQGTSGGGV